jgi:hypothetical protein
MDIGEIVKEGERALPGIPVFPATKPLPAMPQPAPEKAPAKQPERKEEVPA